MFSKILLAYGSREGSKLALSKTAELASWI